LPKRMGGRRTGKMAEREWEIPVME